eukprot:1520677-Pyramimonas_sp.AAC.1
MAAASEIKISDGPRGDCVMFIRNRAAENHYIAARFSAPTQIQHAGDNDDGDDDDGDDDDDGTMMMTMMLLIIR